jgi:glycogen debranching enzyme
MNFRAEAQAIFKRNRRTIGGHTFTLPSTGTYPHQWLWDSCFHAIILSKFEPEIAKAEIRSLLFCQFDDGMIPHMIFWQRVVWPPYAKHWGKKGASSITQPPMLAYAVWEIWRHSPDRGFLEEVYPKLFAYYRYLAEKRDPYGARLAGIVNPEETGEDDSPRFDVPMHVLPSINMYRHFFRRQKLVRFFKRNDFDIAKMSEVFWVTDVAFNTVLIKNLERFGRIAKLLGKEDGERFAKEHVDAMRAAMREKLFHDGVFYSAMGKDLTPLRVETWMHFMPLFAGLYTREEAERLVAEHFHNEETFRAPFGIRTTSKKEAAYYPSRFWRGPVWLAPHWFIWKGLSAYGFRTEADWVRERSQTLVEYQGFREYYNPETGKGYGAHHFTWGALVLDMEGED